MPSATKDKEETKDVTRTMIEDLILLQAEMPAIPKTTANAFTKSKYANLDTITEIAFPIMTKHRFAWITLPVDNEDGEPILKYFLMHTSGESIEGEMKLHLPKQDMQGLGSAITYMRRYALCSVLGLVGDDDDDGNAASIAQNARKATIDPDPPAEPAIQVEKTPARQFTDAIQKLKNAFEDRGYKDPTSKVAFVKDVLGKPQPSTVEEYEQVIAKLSEVPF